MAYSGTTYTNVSGATTAAAGQTVQSTVWNNIHTDLATALTQVMSQTVAITSLKNIIAANGSLDIWQRGAGSSASIAVTASTSVYTADRWYLGANANQACTVAATTALTNNSQLAAAVQRNNAQTGVLPLVFGFPLDTDEIQRLLGNKVTCIATVKAGANWSPTSGTLGVRLLVGTGSIQKQVLGYTNQATVFTTTVNLTPGSAAVAISVQSSGVVPTTTTQAELQFFWTPTGTAGAADTVIIDDVQLEANLSSTTWTPSQFDRVPFEMCLLMCKRHFQKTFLYGTAPVANAGGGTGEQYAVAGKAGAANEVLWWRFPVSLRGQPSMTTYNPGAAGAQVFDFTATASCSAVAAFATTAELVCFNATGNGGTAVGNTLGLHMIADSGI